MIRVEPNDTFEVWRVKINQIAQGLDFADITGIISTETGTQISDIKSTIQELQRMDIAMSLALS